MRVKINKHYWQLITSPIRDNPGLFGQADHPKRKIHINKILKDESQDFNRLETVVHEIFHGLFPYLDEDEVCLRAYDLTKILADLGAKIQMPPTSNPKAKK